MSVKNLSGSGNAGLEVVHLRQMHRVPGFTFQTISKTMQERVVLAQFNIALYLIENSKFPVVLESLYDDLDCNNYSDFCKTVKGFFPAGFISNFEELNDSQKEILYEYGAARLLMYLELLPRVFKSTSKEQADQVDQEVEQGDCSKIFSFREEIALEYIKRAANLCYGNDQQGKVILIFGAAHDFKEKCGQYGYKLTEVNVIQETTHQYEVDGSMETTGGSSEEIAQLVKDHPHIKRLFHSRYVSIDELESLAKQDFTKLKQIISENALIDFVFQGILPVNQLFSVHDNNELKSQIYGAVKDGLLSGEVSFKDLLKLSVSGGLHSINSYKTVEDLKVFVAEQVVEEDTNCLSLYNSTYYNTVSGDIVDRDNN